MNSAVDLNILYIDDEVLAVNKPAGCPVIHDSHRLSRLNVIQALEPQYGRLWVVHRLDVETSGALLFARTANAHRQLNEQFQARTVKKIYQLLACGEFEERHFEANAPLRVNGDRKHRTVIDPFEGKPALTHFSILDSFTHRLYLLSASPHTGYTHQIRAHLASLNGWILNDPLYLPHPYLRGDFPPFDHASCAEWAAQYLPIKRLALHAVSIRFIHPTKQEEMVVTAPFPEDFLRSLEILKQTGQA